jgi:hypothetical protein
VHAAKNLHFMKLSPFDRRCENMIGRNKRHAMLRYGFRTRQRRNAGSGVWASVSTDILRHLKGFARGSMGAA